MADLRAVIESLGYADARTLLTSGNAVFSSARPLRKNAAIELQDALTKKTSVSSRFILRSAVEVDDTVRANTLVKLATDPTRLFALFLADKAHLEKAKNKYFPIGSEGRWVDEKEADTYHSDVGRPWMLRTNHCTILSTPPADPLQPSIQPRRASATIPR